MEESKYEHLNNYCHCTTDPNARGARLKQAALVGCLNAQSGNLSFRVISPGRRPRAGHAMFRASLRLSVLALLLLLQSCFCLSRLSLSSSSPSSSSPYRARFVHLWCFVDHFACSIFLRIPSYCCSLHSAPLLHCRFVHIAVAVACHSFPTDSVS